MTKLKAKPPALLTQGHIKLMIYGPAGVGKTWFALGMPNVYYIASESGADQNHYRQRLIDSGGAYLGPEDGALDPDVVLDQFEALSTSQHKFKTVVLDSGTKNFQTIIAEEAQRLGDKDAFGASKKPAVSFMRKLVNWISRVDMNVVIIAHEMALWEGEGKDRKEVGKVADIWDKTYYELDLVLHCQKRGPARLAQVKKTRLLGFPDGETFPLDYASFAERYGKGYIEATPKVITLAAPEQVGELMRLIEETKTAPEIIQKWLTAAKAESFAEMETSVISKCIEFLKQKTTQK